MAEQNIKETVSKAIEAVTKDLPKAVKENKGAVIGAAVGYFLGDTVHKHEGLVIALLGGLIGHVADEKGKEKIDGQV